MGTFRERYQSTGFWIIALLVLVVSVAIIVPFIPALLWAMVISVLVYPGHRRIEARIEKWRLKAEWKPSLASILTTVVVMLVICVPFITVGTALYFQVNKATSELETPTAAKALTIESVLAQADGALAPLKAQVGAQDVKLVDQYQRNKDKILPALQGTATKAAGNIAVTALTMVFALLTLFFCLRDARRLREPLLELLPLPRAKSEALLSRLQETIHAVFIGVILVAVLQGTIIGIAYAVLQVPNALILGALSVLFSCIPLLGTPMVYIPVALSLLIGGRTSEAIGLLLFGFLIVSQIDNVLRPFFIGARVPLHPIAIFFSLLGGVLLIGPVGLMVGPMLLTVGMFLLEVLREQLKEGEVSPS